MSPPAARQRAASIPFRRETEIGKPALAFPIRKIRRMSSSDNAKSKMSMFSDSRSIREVRGIADNVLLHQPAQANLRGGLAVGPPDPGQRRSFLIRPFATGL